MKRRILELGILGFLLGFGLVLSGCDNLANLIEDVTEGGSGNEIFDGTPANEGVNQPRSADELIPYLTGGEFDDMAGLGSAGGKLYINGEEVVSGGTMIQPTDRVRILAPKADAGTGNNGTGNNGTGGKGETGDKETGGAEAGNNGGIVEEKPADAEGARPGDGGAAGANDGNDRPVEDKPVDIEIGKEGEAGDSGETAPGNDVGPNESAPPPEAPDISPAL
jgi:hypothetical protein